MTSVREDRWARTVCNGCYGGCSVRVHVIDGVAVKVEGDPDSIQGSQGGVCAKSSGMLQQLYHPQRINYPLRRTNPNKGIGVDPKWKRISWDEALGETAERFKKIHEENPGKLVSIFGPGNYPLQPIHGMWHLLFGSYPGMAHMSVHCGNSAHLFAGMNHCSWSVIPDYEYCNYVIHFGSNKGVGSGHSAGIAMRKAADARARGMRMVAFDPMCNFAGGKAKEWLPILPGTDSAVCLAMANIIVNELGMYDVEYLKRKTNLPYLVKPDGTFARDEEAGEPLIWDEAAGMAKKWNEPIGNEALEGTYEVQGVKCQTAFSLLKEHLKQYNPEWAEKQSTVPAETIRRIATEFATEARIGSTIEVQGVRLPYRPVSAIQFRGGQGHTNGSHSYLSVDMLNQLVGACEVPGGTASWAVRSIEGYPGRDNPKFTPYASKDGLLGLTRFNSMGFQRHISSSKTKNTYKARFNGAFHCCYFAVNRMSVRCRGDMGQIWGTSI
jgi:molybdopterin-containing oxidoreductase family molybdopterin binding subunit